ncbi:hypothetical protein PUV47_01950 [Pseudovibrio exalbescens]|uniref:hypothetical protein n=1 Tax=Pseudovibrio exalbescens TaxID=197461 RepID=UPI002366288D|nr:hypothetical protein [Pseudovibrio exalbescens]MDD7908667.1 hypothetical protein [Pseudovibrio exalbescens]
MSEKKTTIAVDQLILATDNPRHEEVDSEAAAIARLCNTENIEQLARDISEHGVNPAERLIIIPLDEDDAEDDATFIVAEGNRRVCALKLLNDPDLAPASIRKKIEVYAKQWTPITELDVVVITDEARRRHWLMRIHDGAQNGRGRMPWKSEQKTRFTGGGRNAVAQSLLDYAQAEGMLTAEERSGRISHMARLVGNPLIRDVLGLKTEDGPEELRRNRYKADFDLVLGELLEETKTKSLGSQAKKEKIDSFAHQLQNLDGLSHDRIDDSEILFSQSDYDTSKSDSDATGHGGDDDTSTSDSDATEAKKPSRPRPAKRSYNLAWSQDIANSLEKLGSEKLLELHWSICTVNAQKHAPLVAVGVWSFLDSLAALAGASDDRSFVHFWKAGEISRLGVAKGDAAKTINNVLDRLSKAGNNTKHDAKSAHFDYRQLVNDWTVITPLILEQLKEINSNE